MRQQRKASRGLTMALAMGIGIFGFAGTAAADVIIAPVSAVCNVSCPGFGSLTNTIDQSGLSIGYTSGVTDFDAYLALNPTHTNIFPGFEWFSSSGSTTATVTYNLGAVTNINRLALFNEEVSGIGLLNLFYSTDNILFLPLALGLLPTDNPANQFYRADVFSFAATNAQYVRFEMSRCPQPNPGSFPACAIGEVAFASGEGTTVAPEPGTMLLLGSGLAGLAARRRRQAKLAS